MVQYYYSVGTSEGALTTPLEWEPSDYDPIKPVDSEPRLNGKITQRGNWGVLLSWDVLDDITMARLRLAAGGAGSASARAWIQLPDFEQVGGVETWGKYYGWADRPVGALSQTVSGQLSNVQMRWRDLVRMGDGVAV